MSAQWKMMSVSLVCILVIVIVACLAAEGESFEHRLKMLTFSGWFQPWGHFSLPTEGQAIQNSSLHIPRNATLYPAPTPAPQYSACFCLGHWHQKCSHFVTVEWTKPLLEQWQSEWEALEAASASTYCSKQFSSGSNLHVPFTCTPCLWFPGPPSIDGVWERLL